MRQPRLAIVAAAFSLMLGCGNGHNHPHETDSVFQPPPRSTGTVVTTGRPGDHWLDTMEFLRVARASRGGRFGYEARYQVPGRRATFTLFWSRDRIDFQGASPGYRLEKMPLGDGQLYYPDIVTQSSLPHVYWAIQILEQDYKKFARGGITAAEAFATIAAMGGPPRLGPTPRGPPPRPGVPAARVVGTKFKPFTEKNFRENLRRLTGHAPKGAHAHHVFPKVFIDKFQKAGINIHNPRYGAWWSSRAHLSAASAYNAKWREFFRLNNTSSTEKIFQFARKIAKDYELRIYF